MKAGSFALAAVVLAVAGTADAHHSAAIYDRANPVVLRGVIREMQWTNPHGWIEVLGTTEGSKPTAWTIEMEGPNVMQREGWSRNSIAAGDKVTVKMMPLKDGRPGARLIELTKADGTVLHLFTPRGGARGGLLATS